MARHLHRDDEQHVEQLRHHQGCQAAADDDADLAACIERRCEDLHHHQADQTNAVRGDRGLGRRDVRGRESSVMKQRRHQRRREHDQGEGRGHRQQHRHPQAPVEQSRVPRRIARRVTTNEARQDDRPGGNAEQRGRKLHQAIGVRQPRHGSRRHHRRNLRVDQQADLRGRHAEQRGYHQLQHARDVRVAPPEVGDEVKSGATQRPHHQQELGGTAGEHADRERGDRHRESIAKKPRGSDHHRVQQYRCEGDDGELLLDVEHRAHQRDQRHPTDVAERDARQVFGNRGLFRIRVKTRREQAHQRLWPDHHQHDDQRQHKRHQRGNAADEARAFLRCLSRPQLGQHGDERLGEGTFGEQATQHVRRTERDVERVHLQAGAEPRRREDLARQAEHARQQRHAADGRHRPDEIHRRRAMRGAR